MRGVLAIIIAGLVALADGRAIAQSSPTDSFQRRIIAIRTELLSDPAKALVDAQVLADDGRKLADERERARYLVNASWLRSEALISLNQPERATQVIRDALPTALRYFSDTPLPARLLLARGGAATTLHQVETALADYQAAYRQFSRSGEIRGEAVALQSLAQIYTDAEDYTEALKYQRQSIEAYDQDPMLLLSAYNNRGVAYFGLHQYELAAREYQRALAIAESTKNPLLQARILQNIAMAQAQRNELSAADAALARAYSLTGSGPAAEWRPAVDAVAALVAFKRNDLRQAEILIERALAAARRTAASMPMRDLYHTAYRIFEKRGENGKALDALKAFMQLDNQQRSLAASTNAALMNANFHFTNQQVQIARLDREKSEAAARFRSRMLLALLSAAAIISTLLLIGFLSIRRSRNQVRAANTTLSTTNVALEKALAAKTEFLATTSHEIRTPLNGILGMTQVILAGRQLDPTLRGRIELVHGAGETMKALVDDILDVAKMETGELRIQTGEMDLKRLLEDAGTVWTGQAETKRIGIEFDLEHCPAKIIADEVRLRQIIFNLMSNAIKFTDRGHVRLAAFAESVDEDDEGQGERLVVRVADSGIGIPQDRLEEIFESFRQVDGGVTRRHGGTGLGLAICRSLARAMGGDVAVASTLGAGSTFTLTLPLVRGAAEAARADRPAATSLATAELLMVEPNPLGQGIMRALLAGECADVQFVADVPAALQALDAGSADHVIAEGSSLGLDPADVGELAAACAAANVRFTLVWREPTPELLARFAEQGAYHVVSKPISAPDLLSEMNKVYDEPIANRTIAA